MLGMILSGQIADSIGWSWIFYIFGMCSVMFSGCWYWLISETPGDHPSITSEELEYVTSSIGILHKDKTPWKSILTSLPFWAFVVSHFVCYWNFNTLTLQLPTFLSEIRLISLSKVGYLSALPFPVTMITKLAGGQLADLIRSRAWLSTTNVRKISVCAGYVGQGVTLLVACQTITGTSALICLTLSAGFSGFIFAVLVVNPQDMAPQFADIIWTVSSTGSQIASFGCSATAGALTNNKTPEEWQHVFYLCSSLSCLGFIVSCFFISGSLQSWAAASANETTDHAACDQETISDHDAEQKSSQ